MSITRDLNYLKAVFFHPCATPSPAILVKTAFPAAIVALVELTSPGPIDVVATKLGKPFFHHKGLNALLKGAAPMVKLNPLTYVANMATGLVRGALYYPWIIGVGTSFVRNWVSMVYVASRCDLPGAGYLGAGLSSLFAFGGGGGTVLIGANQSVGCAHLGGNTVTVQPGCYVTISYECTWEPFQGNPANQGAVQTWIEDGQGNILSRDDTGTPDKDGKTHTGGGQLHAPGGGVLAAAFYQIKFSVAQGLMGCTEGFIRVSAYGSPVKLIPTGLTPKDYRNPPYPHTAPPEPVVLDVDQQNTLNKQNQQNRRNAQKGKRPATPRLRRPRGRRKPNIIH